MRRTSILWRNGHAFPYSFSGVVFHAFSEKWLVDMMHFEWFHTFYENLFSKEIFRETAKGRGQKNFNSYKHTPKRSLDNDDGNRVISFDPLDIRRRHRGHHWPIGTAGLGAGNG